MQNQQNKESTKIPQSRSAPYPYVSLKTAIDTITLARQFGEDLTDDHLAGTGSKASGGYLRKRASLSYYGLVNKNGEIYNLTDLAKRIIFHSSEDEKNEALKEAFLRPDIFNKMFAATQKDIPISVELLGNISIRTYGIQPSVKDHFLSTFIKSGIYVGLIRYKESDKSFIILQDRQVSKVENNPVEEELLDQPQFVLSTEMRPPSKHMNEVVQLDEGQFDEYKVSLSQGTARLFLPKNMDIKDSKKLKALIDVATGIYD